MKNCGDSSGRRKWSQKEIEIQEWTKSRENDKHVDIYK